MPRSSHLFALLLLFAPLGHAQEEAPEARAPRTEASSEARPEVRPRARLRSRLGRLLRQRARILRHFDRDHDGRLSEKEKRAVQERRRAKRDELKQRARERRQELSVQGDRELRLRQRARLLRRLEGLKRQRGKAPGRKSGSGVEEGRGCCMAE